MERIEEMQNEPHRQHDAPLARPATPLPRSLKLALAALCAVLVPVGAYVLLRETPTDGYAQPLATTPEDLTKRLPEPLRSWAKPDVVIVVSGQEHGYITPCGCSSPQTGGLVRRYAFIEALKQKGWNVVGIDLGELNQLKGQVDNLAQTVSSERQKFLKLILSMRALDTMGYRAI